jgi:hypothetical protein
MESPARNIEISVLPVGGMRFDAAWRLRIRRARRDKAAVSPIGENWLLPARAAPAR